MSTDEPMSGPEGAVAAVGKDAPPPASSAAAAHPRPAGSEIAADGELLSRNPRTGEELARFPMLDAAGVASTVRGARIAAAWWSGLSWAQRRSRLAAWRREVVRRRFELAELIAAETGKSADDAMLEVTITIDHMRWSERNAEEVLRRHKVSSGLLMANYKATVEYKPLGVIGVIGPWNYPAFTPMGSIAYALAAGNAVVFKPSEYTPAVGSWLIEAMRSSGIEQQVLFLVTGEGTTGSALVDAGVDKIAFTGSTATARKVMAAAARHLTPVLAECGGKDPMIVAADADLRAAAEAAVWGGMSNAGQTCVGVERILVDDSVADEFLSYVRERADELRAGVSPDADYGPATMPEQLDIVRRHISDALQRGANALVGGVESVKQRHVEPVVLTDVDPESEANLEETFGPVLTVQRVHSSEEAVAAANATGYGLGATVFSKSEGERLARRLRCGMVSVNGVIAFAAIPALPFGGVGDSGFGRIHGADGLREFCYAQSISSRSYPGVNVQTYARPKGLMRLMLRTVGMINNR